MGAFTSKAVGFWDVAGQTTWNEAGVPGDGDTVSCTHDVTVRDLRIVGTSPSNQTTAAITVTGATLKVTTGGHLTMRGNGFLDGATLWVGDVVGGGTFEFDNSQAVTKTINYYVAVGCSNNHTPRSWLVTRGTVANPSVVTSNAGGGNGFFGSTNAVGNAPTNDRLNACFLDLQDADFPRIGNGNGNGGTFQSFYPSINSDAGITYTVARCVFDACGDFRTVYGLPNDTNWLITDNRWKNTLGDFGLRFTHSAGVNTGTRTITGNSFDKAPVIGIDNATIDNNFFADSWQYAQGGGRALSVNNNVIRITPNNPNIPRLGDWSGNYIIGDASTYNGAGQYSATAALANLHWCTPVGSAAGTYPAAHCVVDSFGSDGVGDIDYGPNTAGVNSAISFCLVLPDQLTYANGNLNAGTMTTNNGWAGERSTYDHCTFFAGPQGFLAISEAGVGFAGMVDSCRSNIVWAGPNQTGEGFNKILTHTQAGGPFTPDSVNPDQTGWNCIFNLNPAHTATNSKPYYDVEFSSPTNSVGQNDVVGDPQFVDPTRNFSTWVASLQSTWGAGTAFPANVAPSRTDYNAHGLYLLSLVMCGQTTDPDYDARYTLAALLAYVRGGFAPRNAAIQDNGHDGITRGAVEGQFGPPDLGVSVTDVAAIAESITEAMAATAAVNDAAAVTESVTPLLVSNVSVFDAVATVEAVTRLLVSFVSVSDTAVAAEAVTLSLTNPGDIDDAHDNVAVAESVLVAMGPDSSASSDSTSAGADLRLTLRRLAVAHVNYQSLGAYRLRIEAIVPPGSAADPNVFIYLRSPVRPKTGLTDDYFQGTASPADMSEYPILEPNEESTYPFFRLDYVELDFRAVSLADRAWTLLVREVDRLLRALTKLTELEAADEISVGPTA